MSDHSLQVDIVDFNGSFLTRVRDLVGSNPIILVVTKVHLHTWTSCYSFCMVLVAAFLCMRTSVGCTTSY